MISTRLEGFGLDVTTLDVDGLDSICPTDADGSANASVDRFLSLDIRWPRVRVERAYLVPLESFVRARISAATSCTVGCRRPNQRCSCADCRKVCGRGINHGAVEHSRDDHHDQKFFGNAWPTA